MDMASGSVKVEEVTMVTYGDGGPRSIDPGRCHGVRCGPAPWRPSRSILIFGLVGVAVGAHRVGQPFGAWHDVSFLALAWSVFSAFISFAVGGWAAAKVAGLRAAPRPPCCTAAIAWLVAVPILLAMASLGAAAYSRRLVRRACRVPAWVTPVATAAQDPNAALAARNAAVAAVTALLLGLVGGVIGGMDGLGRADDVHALPDAAAPLRHGGLVTCHSYCSGYSEFR